MHRKQFITKTAASTLEAHLGASDCWNAHARGGAAFQHLSDFLLFCLAVSAMLSKASLFLQLNWQTLSKPQQFLLQLAQSTGRPRSQILCEESQEGLGTLPKQAGHTWNHPSLPSLHVTSQGKSSDFSLDVLVFQIEVSPFSRIHRSPCSVAFCWWCYSWLLVRSRRLSLQTSPGTYYVYFLVYLVSCVAFHFFHFSLFPLVWFSCSQLWESWLVHGIGDCGDHPLSLSSFGSST